MMCGLAGVVWTCVIGLVLLLYLGRGAAGIAALVALAQLGCVIVAMVGSRIASWVSILISLAMLALMAPPWLERPEGWDGLVLLAHLLNIVFSLHPATVRYYKDRRAFRRRRRAPSIEDAF